MTTFQRVPRLTPYTLNFMATFGITLISGAGSIVESADITHKAEFKRLIDSTGAQYQTRTFDTSFEFSAKGKGSNPYSVGVGNMGFGAATGKAFITKASRSSKNDDFISWEASGVSYPNAS